MPFSAARTCAAAASPSTAAKPTASHGLGVSPFTTTIDPRRDPPTPLTETLSRRGFAPAAASCVAAAAAAALCRAMEAATRAAAAASSALSSAAHHGTSSSAAPVP